jgi:hypothetical protein
MWTLRSEVPPEAGSAKPVMGFHYFRVRSLCFVHMPNVYALIDLSFLFVVLFVAVNVVVLVEL